MHVRKKVRECVRKHGFLYNKTNKKLVIFRHNVPYRILNEKRKSKQTLSNNTNQTDNKVRNNNNML